MINRRRLSLLASPVILLCLFSAGLGGGAALRVYLATQASLGEAALDAGTPGTKLSTCAAALWERLLTALGRGNLFTFERLAALLSPRRPRGTAPAFAAGPGRARGPGAVQDERPHLPVVPVATGPAGKLSEFRPLIDILKRDDGDSGLSFLRDAPADDLSPEEALSAASAEANGAVARGAPTQATGVGRPATAQGAAPAAERNTRGRPGPEVRGASEGRPETVDTPSQPPVAAGQDGGSVPSSGVELRPPAAAGDGVALAGFKSLFGMMDRAARDKVIENLDARGDVWEACARAGAIDACQTALERCRLDPECGGYLIATGPPQTPLEDRGNALAQLVDPTGGRLPTTDENVGPEPQTAPPLIASPSDATQRPPATLLEPTEPPSPATDPSQAQREQEKRHHGHSHSLLSGLFDMFKKSDLGEVVAGVAGMFGIKLW